MVTNEATIAITVVSYCGLIKKGQYLIGLVKKILLKRISLSTTWESRQRRRAFQSSRRCYFLDGKTLRTRKAISGLFLLLRLCLLFTLPLLWGWGLKARLRLTWYFISGSNLASKCSQRSMTPVLIWHIFRRKLIVIAYFEDSFKH